MRKATLTNRDKALGLRRVTMIEVAAYDYDVPVAVCYRLQPVLRPHTFRNTIRVTSKQTDPSCYLLTLSSEELAERDSNAYYLRNN